MSNVVIFDLDETLVETDVSYEVTWRLVIKNPVYLIALFYQLIMKGKAGLKDYVQRRQAIDPQQLLYRSEVLEMINDAKNNNKTLVLATGSHQIYADAISKFIGNFDYVFGSTAHVNLIAHNKLQLLQQHFNQFEYVGDSKNDIPIWQASNQAWVINKHETFTQKLQKKLYQCKVISVESNIPNSKSYIIETFILVVIPSLISKLEPNASLLILILNVLLINKIVSIKQIRLKKEFHYCLAKPMLFFSGIMSLTLIATAIYSNVMAMLLIGYFLLQIQFESKLLMHMNLLSLGLIVAVLFI